MSHRWIRSPRSGAFRVVRIGWQIVRFALGCGLLVACYQTTLATDHYLTIGGGYDATGNQFSLERNVCHLQDLLARQGPAGHVHDVLFADGHDERRDLQFRAAAPVPAANRWMARLFGSEKHLGLSYRDHNVPNVRGAANRKNVLDWFARDGQQLEPGDRLILYVTAHGGRDREDQRAQRNRLHLWRSPSLSVEELADQLATLPEQVPVVLVMVQCYAGGFGHAIFPHGDAENGQLQQNICGFFATTHDRPAAGCTADAETEFAEYSGAFWAAHSGISRTGAAVIPADSDGDGRISLAEAHAFALLTTQSLDVPVKTSEVWLRSQSRFSQSDSDELLTNNPPFDLLVARGAPPERLVITALSAELDLPSQDKVAAARLRAKTIQRQRADLAQQDRRLKQQQLRLQRKLTSQLKREWPELANPWNAASTRLIADETEPLVRTIESLPDHKPLNELWQQRRGIAQQRLDLEKEYARFRRFVRACESVALAINLKRLGDSAALQRHRQLVAAESASLGWQRTQAIGER